MIDFRSDGVDAASPSDTVGFDTLESPREVEVDVVDTPPSSSDTVVENNTAWWAVDGTDDPGTTFDAYTVSDDGTDDSRDSGMSGNDKRGSDGDGCNVRGSTANR